MGKWLKKVSFSKPIERHGCPPDFDYMSAIQDDIGPGSIWECKVCKAQYELLFWETGVPRWKKLQVQRGV